MSSDPARRIGRRRHPIDVVIVDIIPISETVELYARLWQGNPWVGYSGECMLHTRTAIPERGNCCRVGLKLVRLIT